MLILSSKDPTSMLDTIPPPPRPPVFWGGLGFFVVSFECSFGFGFLGFFFVWQICLNIQYFILAFVFQILV